MIALLLAAAIEVEAFYAKFRNDYTPPAAATAALRECGEDSSCHFELAERFANGEEVTQNFDVAEYFVCGSFLAGSPIAARS